jgi:hypothetical protein
MSIFGSIGSFFKKIGVGIGKAFVVAGGRGLTDEVLALAIEYVRSYVDSTLTNDQKREAVVRLLKNRLHIPESIARLAVELAVQAVKAELAKIG